MDDAFFVLGFQRVARMLRDVESFFEWNRTTRNTLSQGFALDKLEHQKPRGVRSLEVIDPAMLG